MRCLLMRSSHGVMSSPTSPFPVTSPGGGRGGGKEGVWR